MKIRPAIKPDVPQIIKLISDVWAEYDCVLDVETEERGLLAPDDYFHTKNGGFWVVEENGEIIATAAVMINGAKNAELKYLYVNQTYRKKGLGEKLTTLALKFAKTKSAEEMILWSDTRFTKAHRLYDRLGFEQFGKRKLDDLNNSIEFGYKMKLLF